MSDSLNTRRHAAVIARRTAATGVVLGVLIGTCGCAPPLIFANAGMSLAEAGTSAFIEGELRAARRTPIDRMTRSYKLALESLYFPIMTERIEDDRAYLVADQNGGDDIEVKLTRNSDMVTSVRIRIGVFGDQAIARLVMEEAEKYLNALQGEAPAAQNARPAPGNADTGPGAQR